MSGIDYGMGQTNIDHKTGIRYGVIPANDVGQSWYNSAEPDYGVPLCPDCTREVVDSEEDKDYYCEVCKKTYWSDDCFGDEPVGWYLDDGEYQVEQTDYDIFVTKSPYYTRASYCSPCAPGACHLRNPNENGEKCYCFGHDWFDDEVAPYPVYRVSDDSLVEPN